MCGKHVVVHIVFLVMRILTFLIFENFGFVSIICALTVPVLCWQVTGEGSGVGLLQVLC